MLVKAEGMKNNELLASNRTLEFNFLLFSSNLKAKTYKLVNKSVKFKESMIILSK